MDDTAIHGPRYRSRSEGGRHSPRRPFELELELELRLGFGQVLGQRFSLGEERGFSSFIGAEMRPLRAPRAPPRLAARPFVSPSFLIESRRLRLLPPGPCPIARATINLSRRGELDSTSSRGSSPIPAPGEVAVPTRSRSETSGSSASSSSARSSSSSRSRCYRRYRLVDRFEPGFRLHRGKLVGILQIRGHLEDLFIRGRLKLLDRLLDFFELLGRSSSSSIGGRDGWVLRAPRALRASSWSFFDLSELFELFRRRGRRSRLRSFGFRGGGPDLYGVTNGNGLKPARIPAWSLRSYGRLIVPARFSRF